MLHVFRSIFILACVSLLSVSLNAKIIEEKYINDITKYFDKDALIIFDVDNTLMEPQQELGNDQWFRHRILHYVKEGYSKKDAVELAIPEWMAIQSVTKVKAVEPEVSSIIANLQEKGYRVMGLTTRGLGMSTRTVHQLKTLDINLMTTAPATEEIFFTNPDRGVLYRGGILFTANTDKGEALETFLGRINYHPQKILFINDKLDHLEPVEAVCHKHNIEFLGIRYGFLDEKVKNFREDLASIQFDFFGHILSDETAADLIKIPEIFSKLTTNGHQLEPTSSDIPSLIIDTASLMPTYLYKIVSKSAWEASQHDSHLHLSEDDALFVHFSEDHQLERILDKYWQDQEYYVLKVDVSKLEGNLVKETNPGGVNKYFHLYHGKIPLSAVIENTYVGKGHRFTL